MDSADLVSVLLGLLKEADEALSLPEGHPISRSMARDRIRRTLAEVGVYDEPKAPAEAGPHDHHPHHLFLHGR